MDTSENFTFLKAERGDATWHAEEKMRVLSDRSESFNLQEYGRVCTRYSFFCPEVCYLQQMMSSLVSLSGSAYKHHWAYEGNFTHSDETEVWSAKWGSKKASSHVKAVHSLCKPRWSILIFLILTVHVHNSTWSVSDCNTNTSVLWSVTHVHTELF